ncbi:YqkE family protein [Paenibacillus thermotolerans]|uniref:YqkE family protein n=1 Tax=Paenibacillus thermotolerans TaxID=3027807 RepID=UPI002367E30C|nr:MULTISPECIES: YqkE family protein [unclassified Paenibacillus]
MKKNKAKTAPKPVPQEKAATLKDLLKPELVDRLKAQADAMKAEQARKEEEKRKQAEEARKAEQKRLENDFEYLLNNSSADWKKFK